MPPPAAGRSVLHDFTFHRPRTLSEACALLDQHGEDARPFAGGTALVVLMKQSLALPEHLVSLDRQEVGEPLQHSRWVHDLIGSMAYAPPDIDIRDTGPLAHHRSVARADHSSAIACQYLQRPHVVRQVAHSG